MINFNSTWIVLQFSGEFICVLLSWLVYCNGHGSLGCLTPWLGVCVCVCAGHCWLAIQVMCACSVCVCVCSCTCKLSAFVCDGHSGDAWTAKLAFVHPSACHEWCERGRLLCASWCIKLDWWHWLELMQCIMSWCQFLCQGLLISLWWRFLTDCNSDSTVPPPHTHWEFHCNL